MLEREMVPRLEREIPNQLTPEQLADDAGLHRFILLLRGNRAGGSGTDHDWGSGTDHDLSKTKRGPSLIMCP